MFRKIMLAVAVLVGGATLSANEASAGYRYGGGPNIVISIGSGPGYYGGHRRYHRQRYVGRRHYYGGRHYGYDRGRHYGRRFHRDRYYGGYRRGPDRIVVKHVYRNRGYY